MLRVMQDRALTPDSLDLAAMRSLLVVKPSSLGDVVHTLPAVALIKRAYPQLSIRWVVRSEFMPLLDGNPDLDGTIEFPRAQMRGLGGVFKLFRWAKSALREPAVPDLVIDFQGLARSGVMAWCSGAREVIGLSDSREGAGLFHKWVVEVDAHGHAVDRYLEVPRALGIDCSGADELFRLQGGALPAGVEFPEQPFVMLHPFSRGEGKSLSVGQVKTLCEALAPLPVILVGRAEEELGPLRDGVIDLLNRTSLAELVAVTRRADFVISVDSGPMHIAAALSDRLVSLHTWSEPRMVGPYAAGAWVWKGGRLQKMGEYLPNDEDPGLSREALQEIAGLARQMVKY
ncbi:MAG: heptosyltransferase-1 [Verrucomicrobiales bacterium]|jgi:heptosyltransferase-1